MAGYMQSLSDQLAGLELPVPVACYFKGNPTPFAIDTRERLAAWTEARGYSDAQLKVLVQIIGLITRRDTYLRAVAAGRVGRTDLDGVVIEAVSEADRAYAVEACNAHAARRTQERQQALEAASAPTTPPPSTVPTTAPPTASAPTIPSSATSASTSPSATPSPSPAASPSPTASPSPAPSTPAGSTTSSAPSSPPKPSILTLKRSATPPRPAGAEALVAGAALGARRCRAAAMPSARPAQRSPKKLQLPNHVVRAAIEQISGRRHSMRLMMC